MAFTKEMILGKLNETSYATLVTLGEKGLTSRTMSFSFLPDDKIFLLTHKGASKLVDIDFSKIGLLHIGSIENDIIQSTDISIGGVFELIDVENPLYELGKEALGKKNQMVVDLLSSDEKSDYQLILLKITRLAGWNYMQMINHEPQTVLI
jgi:hypothetical protein